MSIGAVLMVELHQATKLFAVVKRTKLKVRRVQKRGR